MKIRNLVRTVGFGAAVAVLAAPSLARAQDNQPAEEEDIVVTGQLREENPQDVPISMSVLSEEELRTIQSASDIEQLVPNIQLENFIGFAMPRTGIRGIAQADFNGASTSTNMIYLDDVPMNSGLAQGVPPWDLARAEVLRGPQGTLFGRNATGGAIRYISQEPTDEFEGYADITFGRFDQREIHAAISGPITNTLSGRLSFLSNTRGGDIFNVTRQEEQGAQDWYGVRGVLQWQPTENLEVTLRAQTFHSDIDITFFKTTAGVTTAPGFCGDFGPTTCDGWDPADDSVGDIQADFGYQNLGQSSDYRLIESDVDPNEHMEHTPVSLNVEWDLGFATLTSVTAQMNLDEQYILDNDGSPIPILTEIGTNSVDQFTQEFRLASPDNQRFTWLAGLFYMQEDLTANLDFDATFWRGIEFWGGPAFVDSVLYRRGAHQELDTWAAFLHTTYDLTSDLTLTAAVRYTEEEKTIAYRFRSQYDFHPSDPFSTNQFSDFLRAVNTGNFGTLLSAGDGAFSGSQSWDAVTWRLALDYHVNDDVLLYALIARGFKGGSFVPTSNFLSGVTNPDGSILSVDPEIVTDYEIGVKSDWLDGRLRFNASAFFYDYQDYQTNQLIPSLAQQVLSNLPQAEVLGAEIELDYSPIDNLYLSLALGYTDSEITESTDASLIGNRLPLAQDLSGNASIRYDIHTGIGVFSPSISVSHTGNYFTFKENELEIGDYNIVNARIDFESTDGLLYGALWVRNWTDEREPTTVDDVTEYWGSNLAAITPVQTYGITVGRRF